MRLHFREYGRGDPLIILHGLFGSLDNWQGISGQLAARFRVLAVDLRNHGRSPHSAEMNFALMAGDLAELLQEQSLSAAHVLGHSLGGKAAMQFALAYPEKVQTLIVVDIAPRAYEPAHQLIIDALLALDLQSFQNRREIEAALASAIPEPAVRRFLLKNLAQDAAGAFGWKLNLPSLRRNYPALIAPLEPGPPFEKPALFIRGEKSNYIREQDWAAIQQLFPRAELCTIAGAGHWVHAEAPAAFVAAVDNFPGK